MLQVTDAAMAPDKNKANHDQQNGVNLTARQVKTGREIESVESSSRDRSISVDILQHAVDLARKRIRFITREIALNFNQTEPIKRLAWQQLHQGEINAANVATILETWAHRQIATFGEDARPDMETLCQWANEIDNTLQKALNALSDSTA